MPQDYGSHLWAEFPAVGPGPGLSDLCRDLYQRQQEGWPQLAEAVHSLASVWQKEFCAGGYVMRVQLNPARSRSTEAQIDPVLVKRRPCILCADALPPEQKAIAWRNNFLILCNPYPIFSPHFTVIYRRHEPQALEGHLWILLALSRDLGPEMTVFYNGAACGASIPDHFHFQICPSAAIPLHGDLASVQPSRTRSVRGVEVGLYDAPGRPFLAFTGMQGEELAYVVADALVWLKRCEEQPDEPKVNLLVTCREGGGWRMLLFPRRKGRPQAYDYYGDERIVVSPAAVEMGGLMITVNERDYHRFDADRLVAIYGEVSQDREKIERVFEGLSS